MRDNLLDYIKTIPKKEHHIHLDGSVFPYILSQITDKKTQKYIESLYIKDINQSIDSLANFLKPFQEINKLLQTSESLYILSYELVRYFKEQNIVEVDVRFNPHLHILNWLTYEEILEAVWTGFQDWQKNYNFDTNIWLILGADRELPENEVYSIFLKYIEAILKVRSKYHNLKISWFDLNCNEAWISASPMKHELALRMVQDRWFNIIIHAGEVINDNVLKRYWTLDPSLYVKQAVILWSKRIWHGILAQYSDEAMSMLKENNVEVEMNLTSNIQTNSINDITQFPFKKYLDFWLKLSINTDNPAISWISLSEEIVRYIRELNIDLEIIEKIIKV